MSAGAAGCIRPDGRRRRLQGRPSRRKLRILCLDDLAQLGIGSAQRGKLILCRGNIGHKQYRSQLARRGQRDTLGRLRDHRRPATR